MARVVKICGMQRTEDVEAARDADFVGFVVESPDSHRNLSLERAHELMASVDSLQGRIAVTATRSEAKIREIVDYLDPDGVQVTHAFDPGFLSRIHEVTGVYLSTTPANARERFSSHKYAVDAFLLDNLVRGYGGTGETLDLETGRRLREASPRPLYLAGGLTPDNVAEAIEAVDPDGVDVSSGVEADDGKSKDPDEVHRFIEEVWAVDGI